MQHLHFISKRSSLRKFCSTSSPEPIKPIREPWETLRWSATVLITGFTFSALALGIKYVVEELHSEPEDYSKLKSLEKRLSVIEGRKESGLVAGVDSLEKWFSAMERGDRD